MTDGSREEFAPFVETMRLCAQGQIAESNQPGQASVWAREEDYNGAITLARDFRFARRRTETIICRIALPPERVALFRPQIPMLQSGAGALRHKFSQEVFMNRLFASITVAVVISYSTLGQEQSKTFASESSRSQSRTRRNTRAID